VRGVIEEAFLNRKLPMLVALTGLVISPGLVFAHHGTNASYEMDREVTLKGTVTSFNWSNPHCQIYFDVKDEKGNVTHWAAETHSPGQLKNGGWNRETLKAGDEVTIGLNPSRAGSNVGVVTRIVLPNGRSYDRGQLAGGGGGN
jgi:hypothetical protein